MAMFAIMNSKRRVRPLAPPDRPHRQRRDDADADEEREHLFLIARVIREVAPRMGPSTAVMVTCDRRRPRKTRRGHGRSRPACGVRA